MLSILYAFYQAHTYPEPAAGLISEEGQGTGTRDRQETGGTYIYAVRPPLVNCPTSQRRSRTSSLCFSSHFPKWGYQLTHLKIPG